MSLNELSRVAELVNNLRIDTAAYYTDPVTLDSINCHLPVIEKEIITVLEMNLYKMIQLNSGKSLKYSFC